MEVEGSRFTIIGVPRRTIQEQIVYGKCHKRPDLTKRYEYEHVLMKLVGLNGHNSTLAKQVL